MRERARAGHHAWTRISGTSLAEFQERYVLGHDLLGNANHAGIRRTRPYKGIARSRGSPVLDTPSVKVWRRLPDDPAHT